MRKIPASLLGCWRTEDRDSAAEFDISIQKHKIKIKAFDINDGEQFLVRKVQWDGKTLSLETVVPSTQYCAKHRLKPLEANRLEQEITSIEYWTRVKDSEFTGARMAAAPRKRFSAAKRRKRHNNKGVK